MKKIILTLFSLLILATISAQDISIGNQGAVLHTCTNSAKLYDNGGATSSYTAGQSFVLTICSNPGPSSEPIAFEFVSSNFGHQNDFLAFYDAAGTTNPADLIYSFSQTSSQSVGSTYRTSVSNPSGCITLQFVSDATSPGGDFEFNILCLPPCKSVMANTPTANIPVQANEPDYIHSCGDAPITFTGTGAYDSSPTGYSQSDATSTFYWDFGAAGLDTGQVINKSFSPGIYPVKLIVEDAEGCQSTNEVDLSIRQAFNPNVKFEPADTVVCVDQQVDVSTYILSSTGQKLYIGDTLFVDTLKVQTYVNIEDTAYLPDDADGITGNGITTPAIYEFPIFGYQSGATLQDVNDLFYVCLDIEHSFIGDLDIVLECPNGQSVSLIDFDPPTNSLPNNFGEPVLGTTSGQIGIPYTYCWSPAANPSDSIAQGNTNLVILPNGAVDTSIQYSPVQSWDSLLGCPLNGNWTIQVFDDYNGDDGNVFGAAIQFDGSFALNPDTFLVSYDDPLWLANSQILSPLDNDSIQVLPNNPFQPLQFTFTDNLGCNWNRTYDGIEVSTISVENFFKDTTICSSAELEIEAVPDGLSSSCQIIVDMFDSFGDGWNGNNLLVKVDGVVVDTLTVDSLFTNSDTIDLKQYYGQNISIEYDGAGSFQSEVTFNIISPLGDTISDGPSPNIGVVYSAIAGCYPNYTFEWTSNTNSINSGSNFETVTVEPTSNSEYYVRVQNVYGCEAFDTSIVSLDASNAPILDFAAIPNVFCCTGTNLNVSLLDFISGPSVNQIEIDNQVSSTDSLNLSSESFTNDTINYTIKVLANNGCESTQDVQFVRNCMYPSITVEDTIFVGDSKTFTISTQNQYDNMTYQWETTDNSANAITDATQQSTEFNGVFENVYTATGSVSATFTHNNGQNIVCTETAESRQYEVVDILDLRYPTAFTPNGDAINNIFRPVMSKYGEIVDFRIYDRWGDVVYDIKKSDNKEGWDGKYKEKDQAPGIYMYYITIRNFNEVIKYEGTLNLVR